MFFEQHFDSYQTPSGAISLGILLATTVASVIFYSRMRRPCNSQSYQVKVMLWSRWIEDAKFPTFQLRSNKSPFGTGDKEGIYPQLELTQEAAESFLKNNEKTFILRRPGNALVRWETNILPGNDVCEDEMAFDILTKHDLDTLREENGESSFWQLWAKIRRSVIPAFSPRGNNAAPPSAPLAGDGSGDLVFASVIDGHGTAAVSSLLKRVLHASLAWTLSGIHAKTTSTSWTSTAVSQAIIDTYKALDDDIITAPLLLAKAATSASSSSSVLPTPAPSQIALAKIAEAGACALTAFFDAGTGLLRIASAGDSRAVAGWFDPSSGRWRCDTLTQDGEAANPHEGTRLRAEHPKEEAANIIIDEGYTPRLLGSLQCTRAFGDWLLKLNRNDYENMCDVIQVPTKSLVSNVDPAKVTPNPTPPYATAEPEAVVRNVKAAQQERLRFVIVATDGLWDLMSSEEAVLLIAAHLNHPHHDPVSKIDLPGRFPHAESKIARPYPAEALPGSVAENSQGQWTFEDDNAATHLIRNALPGNGDLEIRRKVLSLRGDGARAIRDDISVIVLFFDADQKGDIDTSSS